MKLHLEALAIAANISQSVHTRPDTVLFMFGLLYHHYQSLPSSDPRNIIARDAICASLAKRWAASDQDIFVAAIFLNPMHKARPFRAAEWSTPGGILTLLSRVWKRFYKVDAPTVLFREIRDYLAGRDKFEPIMPIVASLRAEAEEQGQSINPLDIWSYLEHPVHPRGPLHQLARRILSICVNSASCERLFSSFATILTKYRNRMGAKSLLDVAELNSHLHDEQRRNGTIKHRLKRKFGVVEPVEDPVAPTTRSNDGLGEASASASQSHSTGRDLTSPAASSSTSFSCSPPHPTAETSTIPPPHPESPPDDATDSSDDDSESENEPEEGDMTLSSSSSFSSITNHLVSLATASDSQENEPREFRPPGNAPRPAADLRLYLEDLFDFTQSYWVNSVERQAQQGLADELELYELLNLHTDSEAEDTLNSTL